VEHSAPTSALARTAVGRPPHPHRTIPTGGARTGSAPLPPADPRAV